MVRALVIDDDRYVLSLLCDLLGSWGYEVDGVGSPAEGLRRFQERALRRRGHRPHHARCQRDRGGHADPRGNATVGVILFTAATSDLDEAREQLGFTLLRKPLEIETLRRAVREALEPRTV